MARSMTGFGKATCEFHDGLVAVEINAVNHRFVDCALRLPSDWSALEIAIKQTVKKRAARGRFTVTVTRKQLGSSEQTVQFDLTIAQQYVDAAKKLADLTSTSEALSLNVLAQLDGVFYCQEPDENLEEVEAAVVRTVTEALDRLDEMRLTEGKVLADEVVHRVALVRAALTKIEERLPKLCELYEERLRTRMAELLADTSLAEELIVAEVAIMAEKRDVSEELVRLKAHLDHLIELVDSDEPAGRRLDFLTQEAQREANTLGVKVRDPEVTKEILRIKSELEKIREQVQNIE